jgi:hypothetical protein
MYSQIPKKLVGSDTGNQTVTFQESCIASFCTSHNTVVIVDVLFQLQFIGRILHLTLFGYCHCSKRSAALRDWSRGSS